MISVAENMQAETRPRLLKVVKWCLRSGISALICGGERTFSKILCLEMVLDMSGESGLKDLLPMVGPRSRWHHDVGMGGIEPSDIEVP